MLTASIVRAVNSSETSIRFYERTWHKSKKTVIVALAAVRT
jgi:hypothetical protein